MREEVQEQIKQLILTNRMLPGEVLVIDQLAAQLGVSHTPVREALAMLEHDGLVTMRPYGNPRVAAIDESDVLEVCEMRLLLETWAVGKAALALSDEALEGIGKALEHARREAEQARYGAHVKADIRLHGLILEVMDNRLFKRLAQLVNDHSIRIRWLVEAVSSEQEIASIIDEHDALLTALWRRDEDLARERLRVHLEMGRERTLEALARLDVARGAEGG